MRSIIAQIPPKFCSTIKTGSTNCKLLTGGGRRLLSTTALLLQRCKLCVQTMADISGIEKAVRVALGGAVTSVTWSSRGVASQKQQQQQQQQQLQQQQPQMQSRIDAQRQFAAAASPSAAGLGPVNQPYGAAGMTSSMTSQQVRGATPMA